MAKTYQGQLLNKRFFPDDAQAKMPHRCRVTVYVEDEAGELVEKRRLQREAFEEFFATMQALNEDGAETVGDEFDKTLAGGINFPQELDL